MSTQRGGYVANPKDKAAQRFLQRYKGSGRGYALMALCLTSAVAAGAADQTIHTILSTAPGPVMVFGVLIVMTLVAMGGALLAKVLLRVRRRRLQKRLDAYRRSGRVVWVSEVLLDAWQHIINNTHQDTTPYRATCLYGVASSSEGKHLLKQHRQGDQGAEGQLLRLLWQIFAAQSPR